MSANRPLPTALLALFVLVGCQESNTPWCPKTQPGSMPIVRYGTVPGHPAASSVEIRQFPACS